MFSQNPAHKVHDPNSQYTASRHLNAFKELLNLASSNTIDKVKSFWQEVRKSLNDQDTVIRQQQQQIHALQQQLQQQATVVPQTPQRPHTSNSVYQVRDTIEQALQIQGLYDEDASETIDDIYDIDPVWMQNFLRSKKNVLLSQGSELGCWLSGNAPAHENGYVKCNIRNTKKPGTNQNFKCNPFFHQLGCVAAGYGAQLRLTTDGSFHVSLLRQILGSLILTN